MEINNTGGGNLRRELELRWDPQIAVWMTAGVRTRMGRRTRRARRKKQKRRKKRERKRKRK